MRQSGHVISVADRLMPHAAEIEADYDVAIVGGGAAGALVALHLLHAAPVPLRIAIVEPRAWLAQGVAYSTDAATHLLNVVAGRMSAFEDDPKHFVRHLAAAPDRGGVPVAQDLARAFAPRPAFGRYLRATLEAAPGYDRVAWIRYEAVDLDGPDAQARRAVRLASGRRLAAHQVVLAIGNEEKALPLPAAALSGANRIVSAWDHAAIGGIPADAEVCIVGAGLSMVDAVLTLSAHGHRGRCSVLSRHGLLPLPHAVPGAQAGDVSDLLGLGMRARLHALRERAAADAHAGRPWQWTMDALRPHGQALWRHADVAERRRFLRHAARYWDIHRHRIAPQVAGALDALRDAGRLHVFAGRLLGIAGDGMRSSLRYRPRGAHAEQTLHADWIVNATGVETDVARSRRTLLRALLARGAIRPGPLAIGLDTDAHGAILAADGSVQDDVLTLGAMRIGQLWESIAIPELRAQAQRIAVRLVGRLSAG